MICLSVLYHLCPCKCVGIFIFACLSVCSCQYGKLIRIGRTRYFGSELLDYGQGNILKVTRAGCLIYGILEGSSCITDMTNGTLSSTARYEHQIRPMD